MKRYYEALFILRPRGGEDGAREDIEKITATFQEEGAAIEQTQKIGLRDLAYEPHDISQGYYVNFLFEAEPEAIEKLRSRFQHAHEVYQQHYQRADAKNLASGAGGE